MSEEEKEEVKIIDKRRINTSVVPTKEERDAIIDKLSNNGKRGEE